METKFEIGDVLRCVNADGVSGLTRGKEYSPTWVGELLLELETNDLGDAVTVYVDRFELVRRASAQREGGFAVGQRVKTSARWAGPSNAGFEVEIIRLDDNCAWTTTHPSIADSSPCFLLAHLEPADPAPAQPECTCATGCLGYACGRKPMPPQPAPMTRAARVLAGMMADPYHSANEEVVGRLISAAEFRAGASVDQIVGELMLAEDAEPDLWAKSRGEDGRSAKERLAAISLDRPLDAARARWERLVLAKVPVGRR